MLERDFIRKFAVLKGRSNGHSPSVEWIRRELGVSATIDACYLSNPYASEVTYDVLHEVLADKSRALDILGHYPSESEALSESFAQVLGIPPSSLLVCNGVAEIIPWVLSMTRGLVMLPVPTFSAYHDYAQGRVRFLPLPLGDAERRCEMLLEAARREHPGTVVVINPSNPDGACIGEDRLKPMLVELAKVSRQVILDESFGGLVFPNPIASGAPWVEETANLIVVRSLSKEYGIAGLRLGYVVANSRIIKTLREYGCLWNVNSIAELWLERLRDADVMNGYRTASERYLSVCEQFATDIGDAIDGDRMCAIPSRSNFFLLEDMGGGSALDIAAKMIFRHGVYVRACDDKVGLGPTFLRVSARTAQENNGILEALADVCDA